MNEDKMLQQLKLSAEQVEVPESLKPEQILYKLPEKETKRSFYQIGAIAAAFCVLVGGGFMLGRSGWFEARTESAVADAAVEDAVCEAEEPAGTEEAPDVDASEPPELEDLVFQSGSLDLREVMTPAMGYDAIYDHLSEYYETMYMGNSYTGMEPDNFANGQDVSEYEESFYNVNQVFTFTDGKEHEEDVDNVYKTDGAYAYLVKNDSSVTIMTIDGAMQILSVVSDTVHDMESFMDIHISGNKLVRITSYTESSNAELGTFREGTMVYTYDVTDRSAPVLMGSVDIEGYYMGSRLTDAGLYVYTNCNKYDYIDMNGDLIAMDAMEPTAYVPSVNGTLIPAENIYVATVVSDANYVVCASVDLNAPGQVLEAKAFLSFDGQYVPGENHIYLTLKDNLYDVKSTAIVRVLLDGGTITPVQACAVRGHVKGAYAMSEKDGNLRVISSYDTDTGVSHYLSIWNENFHEIEKKELPSAVSSINDILYMGQKAYLSVNGEKPFVSLDMTDVFNASGAYMEKVPGFEGSVFEFGENKVAAISYVINEANGQYEGVRLAMFDTSDPSAVKELHSMVIQADTSPAVNMLESIYVDVEKGLIGFATEDWNDDYTQNDNYYRLYSYNTESGFQYVLEHHLSQGNCWYTRGFAVGSTLYVIERDSGKINSFDMANGYAHIGEISF